MEDLPLTLPDEISEQVQALAKGLDSKDGVFNVEDYRSRMREAQALVSALNKETDATREKYHQFVHEIFLYELDWGAGVVLGLFRHGDVSEKSLFGGRSDSMLYRIFCFEDGAQIPEDGLVIGWGPTPLAVSLKFQDSFNRHESADMSWNDSDGNRQIEWWAGDLRQYYRRSETGHCHYLLQVDRGGTICPVDIYGEDGDPYLDLDRLDQDAFDEDAHWEQLAAETEHWDMSDDEGDALIDSED